MSNETRNWLLIGAVIAGAYWLFGRGGNSSYADVTLYHRPGCPHCQKLMPFWRQIEKRFGAKVASVNCETGSCPSNVRGVPTIRARNGDEFKGNRESIEELSRFVQQH